MANVRSDYSFAPKSRPPQPGLITFEALSKASPDLLDVARRVLAIPDGKATPIDVLWLIAEIEKIKVVARLAVRLAEGGPQ